MHGGGVIAGRELDRYHQALRNHPFCAGGLAIGRLRERWTQVRETIENEQLPAWMRHEMEDVRDDLVRLLDETAGDTVREFLELVRDTNQLLGVIA
jgi:hypothetical protein